MPHSRAPKQPNRVAPPTEKTTRRSYGEGSVYQRSSDGRWIGTLEAGFNENGKRRRITVTGKSESEAARKLTKRRTALEKAEESATVPNAARMTVHAWGAQWLEHRQATSRPKTFDRSATLVRKYADPTLGRKRLVDLTARDLRDLDARVRQHGQEDYVRKMRADFITMLRDAVADGYTVPPALFDAAKSKGHKQNAAPKRKALEVPQAVAVLGQATTDPHYARWVAGFYQGQRQGESLGLTWDAVDLDRGLVSLMWQLQPLPYLDKRDHSLGFRTPHDFEVVHLAGRFHLVRPKTRTSWRVAPMTEDFHETLTAWREVWPENPHGLIWARGNGWPIDKADDAEAFRALQRAAGVRKGETVDEDGEPVDLLYTGHEMRNTCATILTLAGVDPATITAILGHSSWSTSLAYVTGQIDAMRAALRDVNAAYKPKELG